MTDPLPPSELPSIQDKNDAWTPKDAVDEAEVTLAEMYPTFAIRLRMTLDNLMKLPKHEHWDQFFQDHADQDELSELLLAHTAHLVIEFLVGPTNHVADHLAASMEPAINQSYSDECIIVTRCHSLASEEAKVFYEGSRSRTKPDTARPQS